MGMGMGMGMAKALGIGDGNGDGDCDCDGDGMVMVMMMMMVLSAALESIGALLRQNAALYRESRRLSTDSSATASVSMLPNLSITIPHSNNLLNNEQTLAVMSPESGSVRH